MRARAGGVSTSRFACAMAQSIFSVGTNSTRARDKWIIRNVDRLRRKDGEKSGWSIT